MIDGNGSVVEINEFLKNRACHSTAMKIQDSIKAAHLSTFVKSICAKLIDLLTKGIDVPIVTFLLEEDGLDKKAIIFDSKVFVEVSDGELSISVSSGQRLPSNVWTTLQGQVTCKEVVCFQEEDFLVVPLNSSEESILVSNDPKLVDDLGRFPFEVYSSSAEKRVLEVSFLLELYRKVDLRRY